MRVMDEESWLRATLQGRLSDARILQCCCGAKRYGSCDYTVEVAKSGRARCYFCDGLIADKSIKFVINKSCGEKCGHGWRGSDGCHMRCLKAKILAHAIGIHGSLKEIRQPAETRSLHLRAFSLILAGKPLDAETRALDAVRGSLARPVAAPPPASKPKNQGRKRKRGRDAKDADVEIAATKTAEELLDERERLAIINGDVVDVTESQ